MNRQFASDSSALVAAGRDSAKPGGRIAGEPGNPFSSLGKWSSRLVHTQEIIGSNPVAATSFAVPAASEARCGTVHALLGRFLPRLAGASVPALFGVR